MINLIKKIIQKRQQKKEEKIILSIIKDMPSDLSELNIDRLHLK